MFSLDSFQDNIHSCKPVLRHTTKCHLKLLIVMENNYHYPKILFFIWICVIFRMIFGLLPGLCKNQRLYALSFGIWRPLGAPLKKSSWERQVKLADLAYVPQKTWISFSKCLANTSEKTFDPFRKNKYLYPNIVPASGHIRFINSS